jgi:hypothetical protein
MLSSVPIAIGAGGFKKAKKKSRLSAGTSYVDFFVYSYFVVNKSIPGLLVK